MDKKYNGFNNGRDKSDGVGGREVNHGTQETMTKEQILESRISCTCDEAYKSRQMADPDCGRCNWYEEILQCMSEWESQQLSAERERAGKLVEALEECKLFLKLNDPDMSPLYIKVKNVLINYNLNKP